MVEISGYSGQLLQRIVGLHLPCLHMEVSLVFQKVDM